jgi:hypothetical protein
LKYKDTEKIITLGDSWDQVIFADACSESSTNGNNIFLLNTVPSGVDESERIGNEIFLKSLRFHISIRVSLVQVSSRPIYINWCVVRDCRPKDALPTSISDIVKYWDFSNAFEEAPMFWPNLENENRFKILKVGHKRICAGSNIAGQTYGTDIDEYMKLNTHTEYSGATGTIGEIVDNALYLVYRVSSPNSDTTNANIQTMWRLRYTDL